MKGFLPKPISDFKPIPEAKIAIIASSWHAEMVNSMIDRAKSELTKLSVSEDQIQTHVLPGAMELPLAAQLLLEKDPSIDAILAFGVVLKGQTTHDDSVLQAVVDGFSKVSLTLGVPIINEVIGVTDLEDAKARSDESESNKGVEAVYALSEFLSWQKGLGS
jgi:6,7-dimethyl-8-ribityllumazine synthase